MDPEPIRPATSPACPPRRDRRRLRALLAPALALTALLPGCGEDPLQFKLHHVPVAHDGFTVLDAVAVRLRSDDPGCDIVVATAEDLRFLRRYDLHWRDETPGTGLGGAGRAERLTRVDGDDLLLGGADGARWLDYSGIGSWAAGVGPAPDAGAEDPLRDRGDLDGDGRPDEAWLDGNRVRLGWAAADGTLRDVSARVGLDGLSLPEPGRRLRLTDIDGDGDLDLLVVGGRLFALLNNGGVLDGAVAQARGRATPSPASTSAVAAMPSTPAVGVARTAGDEPAPARADVWFRDVTDEAGLAFLHSEGGDQWDIRPTMGPGAAFADVDGDADPDLYLVGGAGQVGRLMLNDGAGHFLEGHTAWGLGDTPASGMGALFADLDDDGDPDLYLTNDGPNRLLRHDGEGYTDVTATSGTGDARWGASAAVADTDRDGDLDLFVTNYLEFDLALIPPESARTSQRREDPLAMLPYVFPGQANVLYRNDGGLRFTDVTEDQGLHNPDGKSLGAVFLDHDADGWPDLYVANDTTPNTLFHNQQGAGFEEVSLYVGVDDPRGGMGLAVSDLDNDGDEDVLLTNWQLEPNALYRNNRVHGETARQFMPAFEDVAVRAGLAQLSVGYVGWGCLLADLDGDADDDVFVANGYTSPDYETTMICVGQADQLFENVSGPGPFAEHRSVSRFAVVEPERAGPHFARELPSRGVAAADVDGDGDLDLAVTANNGPFVLLRNERGGRYLHVELRGTGDGVTRDAIGARVTLELADGTRRTATLRRGSGYLGNHQPGVRFGLGDGVPRTLHLAWPDGSTSQHEVDGPGRLVVIQPGG